MEMIISKLSENDIKKRSLSEKDRDADVIECTTCSRSINIWNWGYTGGKIRLYMLHKYTDLRDCMGDDYFEEFVLNYTLVCIYDLQAKKYAYKASIWKIWWLKIMRLLISK